MFFRVWPVPPQIFPAVTAPLERYLLWIQTPGTSQLNDGQRSALQQKAWTDFGNHGVLTAATSTVWSAYNRSRGIIYPAVFR